LGQTFPVLFPLLFLRGEYISVKRTAVKVLFSPQITNKNINKIAGGNRLTHLLHANSAIPEATK